jgi:hypothetical protein
VPAAELEADGAIDARRLEADDFMQPYARRVRKRDRGDGLGEALADQYFEQCIVELPADSAALKLRGDIDRRLDCEAIGGALAKPRAIGVAGDLSFAILRDQSGIVSAAAAHPLGNLVCTGSFGLEADR